MNNVHFLNILITAPNVICTSTIGPVHRRECSNRAMWDNFLGSTASVNSWCPSSRWNRLKRNNLHCPALPITRQTTGFINWISDFFTQVSPTLCTKSTNSSITIHCATQLNKTEAIVHITFHNQQGPGMNSQTHLHKVTNCSAVMRPVGELPRCICWIQNWRTHPCHMEQHLQHWCHSSTIEGQTYTRKVLHVQWAILYGKPGNTCSSVSQLTTTFMKR